MRIQSREKSEGGGCAVVSLRLERVHGKCDHGGHGENESLDDDELVVECDYGTDGVGLYRSERCEEVHVGRTLPTFRTQGDEEAEGKKHSEHEKVGTSLHEPFDLLIVHTEGRHDDGHEELEAEDSINLSDEPQSNFHGRQGDRFVERFTIKEAFFATVVVAIFHFQHHCDGSSTFFFNVCFLLNISDYM